MKSKEWKIPYGKPVLPEALLQAGYPPLLAALLAARGIDLPEAARGLLDCSADSVHDPLLMAGMEAARDRLRQAIARKETVAVYGDYDVDGITATCLLTDYLRSRGLTCLPYIPDRDGEGYGLNSGALDHLVGLGVRLVITVDCGITAVEEAAYARQIGLDMIVTDHHECKSGQLPEACAVVDCKQDGDRYPNPNLAGVGVALKLVCACEGESEAMLARYADLVAVGTVADVMPLTDENRYLVRRGLRQLEESPRPGFTAMFHHAGLEGRHITAASIGFGLAPRLNAAGRMGQVKKAYQLLMAEDPREADRLAGQLCELNRQRQNIETEIWNDAQSQLADTVPEGPIVLSSDRWHQGVIGIAASRLAEQFSLPAIMICLNGEQGKGSCRSYGGFNLYEALSACSEHLLGFGGHALAAGLTIRSDKLADFRQALNDYYQKNRPAPQPAVSCDLLITDPAMLDLENVRSLDLLEPYGNANPKPVLCLSDVELLSVSDVGGGRHLRLRARLGGSSFDGIFFSHTAAQLGFREGDRVDLAFTPQVNEYRGHVSVQLLVLAARHHDGSCLCRALLEGQSDTLWAAAPYCPERPDFVRLWRETGGEFSLPQTAEEILAGCPSGMAPERYCLCLMTLLESGLLRGPDGRIYGARRDPDRGKVDLEATHILRNLRSM
ncbi:MAG: single-stranded-DNA-specific exonuclease RecJ [Oscillospiraceae bacterium]|nr:single-stranded-DNA-specific exonuclease RecJ [Oscillospiraceae bacterium]